MEGSEVIEGGKRSAWLTHLKKTMRSNKGMSLRQAMRAAKKTYKKTYKKIYKKSRRGGAALSPLPLSGGRRRRGTRSRKH